MKKFFWKNKRILITGANGFFGRNFLTQFQNKNIDVTGVDLQSNISRSVIKLDILQEKKIAALCRQKKINLIIHCAGLDGNAEFKKNKANQLFSKNIKMAANVLNVAKSLGISELVIFSSAEIYTDNSQRALKENDDYFKYPINFDNSYAVSKIATEIMARFYAKKFGLKILLPRPTNVYGSGDKKPSSSGRVIPSMINKILSGQEIEIWGGGQQRRDFLYINDLVSAVVSLVEANFFSIVNIAAHEPISINTLAARIAFIAKRELKIKFNHTKTSGASAKVLSTSKLKSLINFKPIKLESGLRKTIAYYRQNYE
jgi:dTDP-4-dehydro-6-deoxy-alpha-D-gulose 4-ketoreductase